MKQINRLFVAISCVLFLSVSCKKNNDNAPDPKIPGPVPPVPVCRLTTISSVNGTTVTTISLSYNNDGEVSIIKQTGGNGAFTKVFTYNGNTIRITTTNQAGNVTKRDSVQLNSNKLIAFSQSTDVALNRKTVNKFTYGSNGQLQQSTTQTDAGPVSTSNYTFSNGDLVSISGATTTTYTHYTDRPLADGDFLKLFQLINNGGFIIRNAHLIKSQQTGGTLQNYIYDFDASGKITRLTGTNGSTIETLDYQYECK